MPGVVDSRFTEERLLAGAGADSLDERLDRDAFAPFLREPRPDGGRLELNPWESEQVNRCFGELDLVLSDKTLPLRPCRARAALIRLLYGLGYREEGSLPVETGEPWRGLLLFLNQEFSRRVTIGELCDRFATNRNTLSREFKKLTGKTIGVYLEELRFRLACRLLKETRLPVIRIAADCGFGDASGMGRVFRNRTGAGPGEWRKGGGTQSP
jgi:AraC-like DNA-binding protein